MEQPNDRDKLSLNPNLDTPVLAPQDRGLVLCKIREYKTPVHEVFRCYRYVACVPNLADFSKVKEEGDRPQPLFAAPYLVLESSDISTADQLEWHWIRFVGDLMRMGFTSVESI